MRFFAHSDADPVSSSQLEELGAGVIGKIKRRESLAREDLVSFCTINQYLSRRALLAIGVFALAFLLAMILGLIEEVFGYNTRDLAGWIFMSGGLLCIGLLSFQNSHHYWEIANRLYCYHCHSSFGAKDVHEVLDSGYCPYCAGLNPIIQMGFEKPQLGGGTNEPRSNLLSETEFSEQIYTIQEGYYKRGSWELIILVIGSPLSVLIFGTIFSVSNLTGVAATLALFALLAVNGAIFWQIHRSDLKRFRHTALSCPSCHQGVLLCVAERTGCCQHCGIKLFKPGYIETASAFHYH